MRVDRSGGELGATIRREDIMVLQSRDTAFAGALLIAWLAGCSAGDVGGGEALGSTALGIGSWTGSNFLHILRVNDGETAVRNRCELTIPLSSAKPLTIIASALTEEGTSMTAAGWTGSAVSVPGLAVTGCDTYPCDVTARSLGTASNGTPLGCELVVDDGVARLVGSSSESSLTVNGAPSAPVIFHQHLEVGPAGISGACILRQSAVLTEAQVSGFQVFLNGSGVVSLPDPVAVGNVGWPTKIPSGPFGSVYVGSEPGATRLKHVAPIKEELVEGDTLRCAGAYGEGGDPVFDVNVSRAVTGTGMSLKTDPTGWTCSPAAFGTGDGCDCDCGVLDPDCGVHDCTYFNVTAASGQNYTIDGELDPPLDLVKGRTYVFNVSAPAHPFAIHSVSGSTSTATRYDDGVIGQGVTNGQLKFTPPLTAPSTVHYQCEVHASMTGALNLADP
jgi:hypothetical protein